MSATPPSSPPSPRSRLDQELRDIACCEQSIPRPGQGDTLRRFELLAGWAGQDLSLGRLAEGHADALAILAEAGAEALPHSVTYGVWAARGGQTGTCVERRGHHWRLSGTKDFCSGAGVLDRALVTAEGPDGYRLFDVDLGRPGITVSEGSWLAVGMADSLSSTVTFEGVDLSDAETVGGPGFYLERPGFFFGGIGVAACWFGGARALVERLARSLSSAPSEHVLADLGRAVTAVATMDIALASAARRIDADPLDVEGQARYLALSTRQMVHRAALDVLEWTAAAGGARPLSHDADQSRRAADLYVYLSQHHGSADAAQIGRLALDDQPWR